MILYNMRYRGPFEYDKFALNTLQFHNEVYSILLGETDDTEENIDSLILHQGMITDRFNKVVKQAEDLYISTLNFKE
jgi:hypothetical protein